MSDLSILFKPSGRNGTATVTTKIGDEVLALAKVDLAKPEARAKYVTDLCKDRPGIDAKKIEALLLKEADAIANRRDNDKDEGEDQVSNEASADLLAKMPEDIRNEARAMLAKPNLTKIIIDDVAAQGVAGERELVLVVYLVGTSRLLDKPVSARVQGPSSSGKSYTIEKTASAFPPEAVIHATQMTPQALFHMRPGSLRHQFVVAGERSRAENDDTAEATRALREMISAGKLVKLMPVKKNGEIVTEAIEQDGPIAFVESTTLTKVFDEDANRCVLMTTDERIEQTRKIVATLAAGYAGASPKAASDRIIQVHHAAQRMLQQRPIVVPFAQKLGELFVSDRVETRRAFPQLMSMIQASALLHQFQRQEDTDGRLLAVADDYQLAAHLLAKPFARLLGGGLSDPALRLMERLEKWAAGNFTTSEVVAHERAAASERSVRGWLSELRDGGAIEVVEAGRGPKAAIWRMAGVSAKSLREKCGPLPAVEKVFP